MITRLLVGSLHIKHALNMSKSNCLIKQELPY
jgi:hypothetical protein